MQSPHMALLLLWLSYKMVIEIAAFGLGSSLFAIWLLSRFIPSSAVQSDDWELLEMHKDMEATLNIPGAELMMIPDNR